MSKKTKKRQSRRHTGNAHQGTAQVLSNPEIGRSLESGFNPDYSQTIKDLRRIGILAGTFFVILIALTFILG